MQNKYCATQNHQRSESCINDIYIYTCIISLKDIITSMLAGFVFPASVLVSVCLVWAITFEAVDIESLFFVHLDYTKVNGSRSRLRIGKYLDISFTCLMY